MDNDNAQTTIVTPNNNGIDKRWFAALDFSMFAAAMIVKPMIGFPVIFPAIVASPWLATSIGHYYGRQPHFTSGIGYSLLTVHALINMEIHRGSDRIKAYRRNVLYVPLMIGLAGLNFGQVIKRYL